MGRLAHPLRLATCLTNEFLALGADCRTATNDTVRLPLHINIDIVVGAHSRSTYGLASIGNIGGGFIRSIACDLWNQSATGTELSVTSRQRYYNMLQQGVIGIELKLPGSSTAAVEFARFNAKVIAASVAETASRLLLQR